MAGRVRAFDWATTPLGPIAGWPQSLKTTIDIMLASGHAMMLAWGPERTLLYNDAYAPMLGQRHPDALGLPFRAAWPDIWEDIAPLIARVFAGETIRFKDMPLTMTRHGHPEKTWWNFSYSPVRDETGAVAGLLNVTVDAAPQVRTDALLRESEARQAFLLRLSDALRPLNDAAAIERTAVELLGEVLGATRTFYATIAEDEESWSVRQDHAPGLPSGKGTYPFSDYQRRRLVDWRKGQILTISDSATDPALGDADRAAYAALGARATIGVPLVRGDRFAAMLAVNQAEPRQWTDAELTLARETAERTWTAIERVRAEAALRESEHQRRVALAGGRMGSWRWDRAADLIRGDEQFMALWGLPPSDAAFPLATFSARMSVQGAAEMAEIVARAVAANEEFSGPLEIVSGPTADTWVQWQGRAAPEAPSVLYGVTFSITEQKLAEARLRESEERQTFLLKLSDALRQLGDADAIQAEAMRRLGEHLGVDRAQYYSADETGEYLSSTGGYTDGVPAAVGRFRLIEFGRYAYDGFHAGETQVVADATTDPRISEEVLNSYKAVGFLAYIGVPFVRRGRFLGTVAVHQAKPRRWTASERLLIEETAERAGIAIEQARAEAALRESEGRHAFLVRFSDTVRGLTDPVAVATTACRMLIEQMNVDRAHWSEIDWKTEEFVTVGSVGLPGVSPIDGRFPLAAWKPYSASHREGRSVVVDDTQTDPRADSAMRATAAGMDIGADLAAPVLVGGRLASVLAVKRRQPHRWTNEEIALVESVVGRCWAEVERAHAETALRESEERQRLTVELVPALLWSASPDGQEVTLNDGWSAYTGQSETETQDYGWLDAIHPDDLPATRAAFAHAFASGEPLERQQRIYTAGNGHRWHLVRHVPVRDEQGAITRWFGAAVDIHESKLAERALQEAERRLQTLVEGVPQLVWRASDVGIWTWASPQWTDYTGQTEGDSHGWGWLDPVHADDREQARERWASAGVNGRLEVDYRIFHAGEQRYRWFQTRATPVRSADGTIMEWLGTSTDVDDLRGMRDRQQVLVAELQHRVRNILTIVRSVFQRTVEADGPLDAMIEHFRGRLDNLARTQVIVTQSAGGQVDLRNLIVDELLGVGVAEGPNIILDGPDVAMDSQTAESISLAIHELTTNAVKYGALKIPGATLAIRWSTKLNYGDGRRLDLTWLEQGVPAVPLEPARHGFGSELIEEALPYRLGAETKLEFRGGGVRCTISVPLPEEPASDAWEDR